MWHPDRQDPAPGSEVQFRPRPSHVTPTGWDTEADIPVVSQVRFDRIVDAVRLRGSAGLTELSHAPATVSAVQWAELTDALHDFENTQEATQGYRHRAQVKLATFSGDSPLEVFLTMIDTCRKHNRWSAGETVAHVQSAPPGFYCYPGRTAR
jgi:hypothetical protein